METDPAKAEPQKTDSVEPVIRLRGVSKSFGGRTVLRDINLDIMPGETMIVMGGSGSGKSTTLRMMIGSFPPDRGSIELFGHDICGMNEEELNKTRKRFGILFQSGALFNSMTVRENVALPLTEHTTLDPGIIDDIVSIKLAQVDMLEHGEKFPGMLSGGQKKRAGLARALSLDPEILFYDEPSAGLDPVTSAKVDRLIMHLSQKLGVASVVVTHEMDSAFTIADRMAMLNHGEILRVESRAWYDDLRSIPFEESKKLPEDERLIRQFLLGEAEGPIGEAQEERSLEQVLFGDLPRSGLRPASVESTRG